MELQCLADVEMEFDEHWTDGLDVNGQPLAHARRFVHRAFLGVVLADTPARATVANGIGQTSYVGGCT